MEEMTKVRSLTMGLILHLSSRLEFISCAVAIV